MRDSYSHIWEENTPNALHNVGIYETLIENPYYVIGKSQSY